MPIYIDTKNITNSKSGTPSITFNSKLNGISNCSIYGNGVQNGTPSPTNIVPVDGCGEQTSNLWSRSVPLYNYSKDYKNYNPDNAVFLTAGTYTISSDGKLPFIQAFDSTHKQYDIANVVTYDDKKYYSVWDGKAIGPIAGTIRTASITILIDCIITIAVNDNLGTYIMINSGTTAQPYEPYGYKIPITCANETTPIYTAEEQTIRNIKKLTFTGTETGWQLFSGNGAHQFYISNFIESNPAINGSSALSNIAPYGATVSTRAEYSYGCYTVSSGNGIAFQMYGSVNDLPDVTAWTNYLKAQYEAGTPVEMWYILATPTTSIVNEPLMKIGNYIDKLTFTDSQIQIPTTEGTNTLSVDTTLPPSNVEINYTLPDYSKITKIYGNTSGNILTKSGTSSIIFHSKAGYLNDYNIFGNGQQNGTPSPDNPVLFECTGNMTENMLPAPVKGTVESAGITIESDGNGNIHVYGTRTSGASPAIQLSKPVFLDGTYYVHIRNNNSAPSSAFLLNAVGASSSVVNITLTSKNLISQVSVSSATIDKLAIYVTPGTSIDMTIQASVEATNAVTNYEPYGWEVPVTMRGANLFDHNRKISTTFTLDTSYVMNGGAATLKAVDPNKCDVTINSDSVTVTSYAGGYGASYLFEAEPNTEYTFSCDTNKVPSGSYFAYSYRDAEGNVLYQASVRKKSITLGTYQNTAYINIVLRFAPQDGEVTYSNIMLNLGSTALPYEPYREPVTTSIYLGEVQTLRRIRKLVLDGSEAWYASSNSGVFYTTAISETCNKSATYSTGCVCNSYKLKKQTMVANLDDGEFTTDGNGYVWFRNYAYSSISDFKAYLAAQHAAGTPVTVWYILATQTTGIVNEPLAKIGNYADELSYEQTNIQIPTIEGLNTLTIDSELPPSETTITYQAQDYSEISKVLDNQGRLIYTNN